MHFQTASIKTYSKRTNV